MATYEEAKSARDEVLALVEKKGATVVQVAPRKAEDGDWYVEAQTCRPLADNVDELNCNGVSVCIVDHGLPSRSVRRATERARYAALHPLPASKNE